MFANVLRAQNGKMALPCLECKSKDEIVARANYAATVGVAFFLPDTKLSVVEVSREKGTDGETLVHYHLVAKGAPQNTRFLLQYWPLGGEFVAVAKEVAVSSDGTVLCDSPASCGKQPAYPIVLTLKSARGEPQRFVLSAKNSMSLGLAVPFPAEGEDKGCKISMSLLESHGTAMLVYISGLPPDTDVQISGNSAGEEMQFAKHSNKDGIITWTELPSVIGKDHGTDTVTVSGGVPCRPSASLDWGRDSYHRQ
jgi:hypothetical protein